ncbi:hypothetical protein GCM10007067_22140 [Lysobacter bugurensis]|uniref:Uncharacterized protein n=1 Tax=Cognatilysobacter bugurensis TaxID=543356 RepID=A0A918W964_9GAMM|nr:hypothetical protein GCM10007067_22140 [Lysobacter bugurensis]
MTGVADRGGGCAVHWPRHPSRPAPTMSTRKAARPDRIELAERAMLALALVSGVIWAVAPGLQ